MQRFLKFLPLILISLFIFGCKKKPPLNPDATVIGRPDSPSRADFMVGDEPFGLVEGEELSGFGAGDGLADRNSMFSGEGDRDYFPSIYFDFDQSLVRPQDRPLLDGVATEMIQNPDFALLIEGHCDWKGTTEYNLALGDSRAGAVRDYLVSLGVDPARIETKSFGDQQAMPDAGPDQRAQDRRADLVLMQ